MSFVGKCLVATSFLGCVLLPGSLRADTIYSYTGNPYDIRQIRLQFDTTLTGAQLANLAPGTDILSSIASFMIDDGDTPPPTDQGGFAASDFTFLPPPVVEIGTDSLGNITSWNIAEDFFVSYPSFPGEDPHDFFCQYTISTTSGSGGSLDQTAVSTDNDAGLCTPGGSVEASPGTWTQEASLTTPEPHSYLLFGTGLVGLLSLLRLTARRRPA